MRPSLSSRTTPTKTETPPAPGRVTFMTASSSESADVRTSAFIFPITALAAGLRDERDVEGHAAIDRLQHVVEGQGGGARGDEGLHLHARAIPRFGGGIDDRGAALEADVDLHVGERDDVTERDELVRLLRRHDAGDARRRE